ncbi:hypothetical protein CON65_05860 [Bacillus pseudomycoides]|uniref:Uncharacterized protein n=1 Tax=Bacillus pseudomycoides TaxID=64104 RepID=A0AA91VE72_9BACI|nr:MULTISPECIES: hypothetical protein [Bacillus]KXY70701.1 hypothetical protein AT270_27275 [Bacillus cereus]PEB56981.1 hypothetical protein COO03_00335 [Bacillus sp. AFS098217]PED83399.1 hypothetical protein CON65_05860 [Bacillus pseudomycoides]PEU14941.1 hypothetical protein CN525_18095 [Bacillus sp. AFS014408]PEU15345.1 hypothetical protein CN524_07235 [Bacillus sp. AFS019443]
MRVTLDILKSDPKGSWKKLIRDISKLPIYEEVVANADMEKLIAYIESFFKCKDYLVIKLIINPKTVYFVHRDGLFVMKPEVYLTDENWEQIKELRKDVVKREAKEMQKKEQQV